MWKKICCRSNCKVLFLNTVTAFLLTAFLELMERKSVAALFLFMEDRTFVFLYNALIIFLCLAIVFIAKKKYFMYTFVSGVWFVIGCVNGFILNSRKTPFTAVDISMAKSVLPVLSNYLDMWQIVGLVIAMIVSVIGLVCLYLYSRDARKAFDVRVNTVCVLIFCAFFAIVSYVGVGRNLLIQDFDNLIAGYKDYGVAYGFCVTALDTGIDRPLDYSVTKVKQLKKKMDKKLKKLEKQSDSEDKRPNIIFIQLESFFDMTTVKDLTLSEDPLPIIHKLQEETTSGYLKVPVYGAGTINTEFEAITGMSTSYFGTGEYPYRSILQSKTCESMAYILKNLGYTASVIHNNNASFYDRDDVFCNLGFDYFISSENMEISRRNAAGWSTDDVLTKYITNTLESTAGPDYIYTISVQGHGDYPDTSVENPGIMVEGSDLTDDYKNQLTYYVNQTHEMDQFIGDLLARLSEYSEDVIVVAYGDHLPGLDFDGDDLTTGSKYKTPYFIWDNFGYNSSHKDEESGNVAAYQLGSKILGELGITDGVMNELHQTMKDSSSYHKYMKLLEYDMLYGGDFIRQDEDELERSKIQYSVTPVRIDRFREDRANKRYLIVGDNFTDASRVYVNGHQISSDKISSKVISVSSGSLHNGDEITIHQVSETNSKKTLNQSDVYTFASDQVEVISEADE